MKQNKRFQMEEMIQNRTSHDKEFRKKLAAHPKEALKELGIAMPKDMNLHVHEEDAHNLHLIIRTNPKDLPLSQDEIKRISAGNNAWNCV